MSEHDDEDWKLLAQENTLLRLRLDAISALHLRDWTLPECVECRASWPCKTRLVLDGASTTRR